MVITMQNRKPNRRRYPRIPLVAPVRFTDDRLHLTGRAVLRQIATHGAGLYTAEPVEKGDRLLVELSLVTDRNESLNESILGQVVWSAPLAAEGRRSVGVFFEKLEEDHPKLYSYVSRLEEAILSSDETWEEGTDSPAPS